MTPRIDSCTFQEATITSVLFTLFKDGRASTLTLNVDNLPPYVFFANDIYTIDFDIIFSTFSTVGSIEIDIPLSSLFQVVPSYVSNYIDVSSIVYYDLECFCLGIGYPYPSASSVLPSLNGDYYSFNDGDSVLTFPKNRAYIVQRSYFTYSGEATQTIMYDLKDIDGKIISAPHTYCVLGVSNGI